MATDPCALNLATPGPDSTGPDQTPAAAVAIPEGPPEAEREAASPAPVPRPGARPVLDASSSACRLCGSACRIFK